MFLNTFTQIERKERNVATRCSGRKRDDLYQLSVSPGFTGTSSFITFFFLLVMKVPNLTGMLGEIGDIWVVKTVSALRSYEPLPEIRENIREREMGEMVWFSGEGRR